MQQRKLAPSKKRIFTMAAACILIAATIGLAAACGPIGDSVPNEEVTSVGEAILVGGCADGTVEETFNNGMVGCADDVNWASRATVCGSGYRPATAEEWVKASGGADPIHVYWTEDSLRWMGEESGYCSVSYHAPYPTANPCDSGKPMRVCPNDGEDAEGNHCTWTGCGYDGSFTNAHFGGCSGSGSYQTAGTLCVPIGGCADGTVEQTFGNGVVGCAGREYWINRAALCAPGYKPATARQWEWARDSIPPDFNYWADDLRHYQGTASGSCTASALPADSGNVQCPALNPMRVCKRTQPDGLGNICSFTNCTLAGWWYQEGVPAGGRPPDDIGGCEATTSDHMKAGTLCAPAVGCRDGTVEQHFGNGVVGCAGSEKWVDAARLCSEGYRVAGANTLAGTSGGWLDSQGVVGPAHNYWTAERLKYSPTGGSGNCWVSTTSGNSCGDNPMRVCTFDGTDPGYPANTCNWENCGYGTVSPNRWFGGCGGNLYAGALCVPEVADTGVTPITVTGMSNYCSVVGSGGAWGFAFGSGDPCAGLTGSGGTIKRKGLYSTSGTNYVIARCDGFISKKRGTGDTPLSDAFSDAAGKSNCIFTVAPYAMPIFRSPFYVGGETTPAADTPTSNGGFDFATTFTLDVSQFGQFGSTAATSVDWKGRDRAGAKNGHNGYDWGQVGGVGLNDGEPILAVADGRVLKAWSWNTNNMSSASPWQNEVILEHTVQGTNGYREKFITLYAHLGSIDSAISEGKWVTKGTTIGTCGNTGNSGGSHLHFSVARVTNTADMLEEVVRFNRDENWVPPSNTIPHNLNQMMVDPYGWEAPQGVDPLGYKSYYEEAGALTINLWEDSVGPSQDQWE